MKVFLISDQEYPSASCQAIRSLLDTFFTERGFTVEEACVGREDLSFCMGCFGCWVKTPGECVIPDAIARLNRSQMNSDVVVFLSPVVFGQFSANIKNVIDRWLPNVLPFFQIRKDGSSMHPPRYAAYPKQIIIGYGDDIDAQDQQLFRDITCKHGNQLEVLLWQGDPAALTHSLQSIDFQKVGGPL